MLAGTFFGDAKDGVVLNETAVKQLGLTATNAIGKQVETGAAGAPVTITGVMKDYNFASMGEKIGAVGFAHIGSQNIYRYMAVKLQTGNMPQALNEIKAKWKSVAPTAPFDYIFMDEKFASLYKAELQLKTAANIATILNMIIVLLGIIGVVAFMLNKRTKEVAVRKVLGAGALNIIFLFIKEYAILILVANIIAWPVAYFTTEKLLQNFAYRINQDVVPYLMVLVFVALVAFALIAAQCFKTAVSNPIKSLRTE